MINLIDFAPNLIAIFIFVLVVSGNYLGELFPCQVQRIFAHSMLVKHTLGFMTLLFFVVLTIPEMQEQENMLGYTGLVYLWFIMMAKCYYTLWFAVFGIVGLIYLLQMWQRSIKKDDEEKEKKEEMIEEGKKYLSVLTLVLTAVGFTMYMGAKKLEYKDKFRYVTFLFGKPECRGDDYHKDKDIGYLNLLKHAID
jgi:hypothetical protein